MGNKYTQEDRLIICSRKDDKDIIKKYDTNFQLKHQNIVPRVNFCHQLKNGNLLTIGINYKTGFVIELIINILDANLKVIFEKNIQTDFVINKSFVYEKDNTIKLLLLSIAGYYYSLDILETNYKICKDDYDRKEGARFFNRQVYCTHITQDDLYIILPGPQYYKFDGELVRANINWMPDHFCWYSPDNPWTDPVQISDRDGKERFLTIQWLDNMRDTYYMEYRIVVICEKRDKRSLFKSKYTFSKVHFHYDIHSEMLIAFEISEYNYLTVYLLKETDNWVVVKMRSHSFVWDKYGNVKILTTEKNIIIRHNNNVLVIDKETLGTREVIEDRGIIDIFVESGWKKKAFEIILEMEELRRVSKSVMGVVLSYVS
jgi:hypothetical protein